MKDTALYFCVIVASVRYGSSVKTVGITKMSLYCGVKCKSEGRIFMLDARERRSSKILENYGRF